MAHIHELYDFTVSAYILHPTEGRVLLHFHQKLKTWMQIGGHIELDEQPLESLERELEEEAGLKREQYDFIETTETLQPRGFVSLMNGFALLVFNYADSGHKHIDIPYIVRSKTDKIQPADGESQEYKWCDETDLTQMNADGLITDGMFDICKWVLGRSI